MKTRWQRVTSGAMFHNRFNTLWGMVLEMVLRGEVHHVWVPLRDHDIKDLETMAVEKIHKEGARDAESFLAAMPNAQPASRVYFAPSAGKGTCAIGHTWIVAMPTICWGTVHVPGVPPHSVSGDGGATNQRPLAFGRRSGAGLRCIRWLTLATLSLHRARWITLGKHGPWLPGSPSDAGRSTKSVALLATERPRLCVRRVA